MIVAMTIKLPDTEDWIITGRFKMQDKIFINILDIDKSFSWITFAP